MVMTSVSGHLLSHDFAGQFKNWRGCNPLALFDAPVVKYCPKDYENIKVSGEYLNILVLMCHFKKFNQ